MIAKEVLRRLDKLTVKDELEHDRVMALIDSGLFYEDLSREEQEMYNRYRGNSFKALNAAFAKYFPDTKTTLERKPERSFSPLDQAIDALF